MIKCQSIAFCYKESYTVRNMKLLVFAHRGEAKTFLRELALDRVRSEDSVELFCNEDLYLLICGEGIDKALMQTSYVLGKYEGISEIFNIGICGSLAASEEKREVFEVSSINANSNSHFEFKSFECQQRIPKTHNLISTNQRILEKSQVEMILPLGDFVDREAWGVALAAHQIKKQKIVCLKLASDFVQIESQFCERVKEQSIEFSDKLFDYYQKHYTTQNESEISLQNDFKIQSYLEGYYFTKSQKNKFNSLCKRLNLSIENLQEKMEYKQIAQEEILPKERTKRLINFLDRELNPLSHSIREQLDHLLAPHHHEKFKISYDKNLEKTDLQIQFSMKDQEDIETLIKKLEQLPFQEIKNIFHGDLCLKK